jgi:hypothetical protein
VAEDAFTKSQTLLARAQDLQADLTLSAVQDACAICDSSSQSQQQSFLPSYSTALSADTEALEVLGAAFEAAAVTTSEPEDAVRFQAVADQLFATPAARVLHLSYRTDSAVDNQFVALRSDSFPDDGFSTLAVIITTSAGGSGLNPMELFIALDVWRAFYDALDPGTPPPDDDDIDDDRLHDIFESDTGSFVSSIDSGTDPGRPDSDGDLYFDGAEIATRSDPNDSSSIPVRSVPVPVLPAGGIAMLAALLLAGGAVARHLR